MKYPDLKTYEILYARFLKPGRAEEMLDMIEKESLKGATFLDICCGAGRLTEIALDRNIKKSIMIDSEAKMILGGFDINAFTQVLIMTVEDALTKMRKTNNMVDVAICQQGINYWLTESKAWQLSLLMPIGGIFIFNTFNQRPPGTPTVREYTLVNPSSVLGEIHYIEINWRVKDEWFDIHHAQICEGLPPHFTQFKWMSEEYIKDCLDKYFDIELTTNDKTDIYKCVRK